MVNVSPRSEFPPAVLSSGCQFPQVLLHEVITMYSGEPTPGHSSEKNRAMTAGSTKKLFKQKGTGNARQGTRRTPVRVHGGK